MTAQLLDHVALDRTALDRTALDDMALDDALLGGPAALRTAFGDVHGESDVHGEIRDAGRRAPGAKVGVQPRPSRPPHPKVPVGPGGHPDRRTRAWAPVPARGCADVAPAVRPRSGRVAAVASRPGSGGPGSGRLVWTSRGVAVMVSLVGLVVGIMATTLVTAFWGVSNEPLVDQPVAAVVAVAPHGR